MRPHPLRATRDYFAARPFLAALVVLMLITIPGLWRVETTAIEAHQAAAKANTAIAAVASESSRSTYDACLSRRDTIIVLRQLVQLTASSGGRVQLTAVPGFDELSLELRAYLTNLDNALNAPRPANDPSFIDQALDLLVEPDC